MRMRALVVTLLSAAVVGAGHVPASALTGQGPDDLESSGRPRLISADVDGEAAGGGGESTSANGRFVVFSSEADNLVEGLDGPIEARQVYLHDRRTGLTSLVSANPDGAPGDGDSVGPSISADGRFAVFESSADNLVAGSSVDEIFRADLTSGELIRVCETRDGLPLPFPCEEPTISRDGSLVTFSTWSRNIVRGDRNRTRDVFLRDVDAGRTILVSRSIHGGSAEDYSSGGVISADGRYVVFDSGATDIEEGHGTQRDIVRFDVQSETNHVLTQGNNTSTSDDVSSDGRYAVFTSWATNLVEGTEGSAQRAYLVDAESGAVSLLSRTVDGHPAGAFRATISDGAGHASFLSDEPNIVADDTNGVLDGFVQDLGSRTTVLLNRTRHGDVADGRSFSVEFSKDDRLATFSTEADGLGRGDHNGLADVFVVRID